MDTVYLAIVRIQIVGETPRDDVRGILETAVETMEGVANVKIVSLAEDAYFPKIELAK